MQKGISLVKENDGVIEVVRPQQNDAHLGFTIIHEQEQWPNQAIHFALRFNDEIVRRIHWSTAAFIQDNMPDIPCVGEIKPHDAKRGYAEKLLKEAEEQEDEARTILSTARIKRESAEKILRSVPDKDENIPSI